MTNHTWEDWQTYTSSPCPYAPGEYVQMEIYRDGVRRWEQCRFVGMDVALWGSLEMRAGMVRHRRRVPEGMKKLATFLTDKVED